MSVVDGGFDAGAVGFDGDGLVPAVVQDVADGRVLMVAYMDAEALAATLASGDVHFHSRSRGTLWRKGETSGNVLRLVGLAADCDGDALLVTAAPTGPTCHRGTRSCFDTDRAPASDAAGAAGAGWAGAGAGSGAAAATVAAADPVPRASQGFAWLETLWSTIESRATKRPAGSYTTRLLKGGVDAVGRKVVEEATELLMAAKDDAAAEAFRTDRAAPQAALAGEAADLLFHAMVLLAERGMTPGQVIDTLRTRHAR